MTKHIRSLACSIAAATAAASLTGCGGRAEAAQHVIKERPALGVQIERVGRPLTGNALLGPLAPDSVSNARKEAYNRAAPADWSRFTADIARNLALYDAFDRSRGNQWLADPRAEGTTRYRALAKLLADDRLWINANAATCARFLAVELTALAGPPVPNNDCGGRTPNYDAVDVFRSLLMNGTSTGLEDGVARDDRLHSVTRFPFLAAP
jgi:hypothetical protein